MYQALTKECSSPPGGFEVSWGRQLRIGGPDDIRAVQGRCGEAWRNISDPHPLGGSAGSHSPGASQLSLWIWWNLPEMEIINKSGSLLPFTMRCNYILLNWQNDRVKGCYPIPDSIISRLFYQGSFCNPPLNLQKLVRYKLSV